ncbi:MAG: FliA/WhiG family RNA polymerase sigma factor [Acidimicrobiales bacterium]
MDNDEPTGLAFLWVDYKRSGRADLRDKLIVHYSPLVKYVAGRLAAGLPQSIDQADLVSNGIFGLIDAIDKFDPERGHKFKTYAMLRIRGAILDELRSTDWVPRSVRQKARALEAAYATLEANQRHSPSDAELAATLEMTAAQLRQTLSQISMVGLVALDEILTAGSNGTGSLTRADTLMDQAPSPTAAYEVEEMRQILAKAISEMAEREKLVLTLYYYEGLTLAEIGEVLGVSESRVCQIHTKAVIHLRAIIVQPRWAR